jgi:cation transport regulator ChaB
MTDPRLERPDPTVLTTQQMTRAVQAERDYVDGQLDVLRERLTGIDRATVVLNETVNRTPTEIQKEIAHLRELMTERFNSVDKQFQERDTRQERESRDNKVAVDAAIVAQKEAAAQRDLANQKAIDKSELATAETMKAFGELFRTTTDNIKEQFSALELKVTQLIAGAAGGKEKAAGINANFTLLIALAVLAVLVLGYFAAR